jgi:hypothetical protein
MKSSASAHDFDHPLVPTKERVTSIVRLMILVPHGRSGGCGSALNQRLGRNLYSGSVASLMVVAEYQASFTVMWFVMQRGNDISAPFMSIHHGK